MYSNDNLTDRQMIDAKRQNKEPRKVDQLKGVSEWYKMDLGIT